MSTKNRDAKIPLARCWECDSDLLTGKIGKVFCSNMQCKYVKVAHPTGPETNAGKSSLRD